MWEGQWSWKDEWSSRMNGVQTDRGMYGLRGDADCVKPKYHLLWEADKMNSRLHVEHKYYIKLI